MPRETLLAILAMAVITYGTRVGGFWAMTRAGSSTRAERWLRHLPGAVLVAIAAPAVVASPADTLAAGVTLVAAAISRSVPVAMACGVAAAGALRALI